MSAFSPLGQLVLFIFQYLVVLKIEVLSYGNYLFYLFLQYFISLNKMEKRVKGITYWIDPETSIIGCFEILSWPCWWHFGWWEWISSSLNSKFFNVISLYIERNNFEGLFLGEPCWSTFWLVRRGSRSLHLFFLVEGVTSFHFSIFRYY